MQNGITIAFQLFRIITLLVAVMVELLAHRISGLRH